MFTGIVEETGVVESVRESKRAIRLVLSAKKSVRGLKNGDSLAVNGCCLTLVKKETKSRKQLLHFDLLLESWKRTNLQFVNKGFLVNLERSLAANGRFGGHFVTGHVDGLGRIVKWEKQGQDHILEITAPKEVLRYIVFKGSIAVDGMSLTVAKVLKNRFRIWIIPHTFEVTALRNQTVGDWVNLEADMIGKYVERFVQVPR